MPKRPAKAATRHTTADAYSVEFKQVAFDTGEVFFVPAYAQDRPAARKIAGGEYYEPGTHRLVPAILARWPGNMVHAGTFFGDMLPTFSRACDHTVYAFEPVLENYVLAKLCVEANALDNVVLLNAALGSVPGTARIDTGAQGGRHRGGASRIGGSGQRTSVLSIDSLGLGGVSIIQLDVEGFELNALRGAARTIEQNSPVVMIEDNAGNCAPYLSNLDYLPCGEIPGLSIWARQDQVDDLTALINAV